MGLIINVSADEPTEPLHKYEWIESNGSLICANCKKVWKHRRTEFCANCGARMKERSKME